MSSTQPPVVRYANLSEPHISVTTPPPAAFRTATAPGDDHSSVDAIPRSWLIAVCQAFPGNRSVPKLMILLLEAFGRHLIDQIDFTIRDLLIARDELGVKLTDSTIRSSMKKTEGLFWNLNTEIRSCSNTEITSRGGRPEQHFKALPLDEIADNLLRWAKPRIVEARHQEWKTSPKLTEDMISVLDGDAYRAAREILPLLHKPDDETRKTTYFAQQDIAELARALNAPGWVPIPLDCDDVRVALFKAEHDPNEPKSYRDIHCEYGVSVGGVKPFAERAGFKVETQFALSPITSATQLERQVAAARKETHGFPSALLVTNASGEVEECSYAATYPDAYRQMVESALGAGSTVQLKLKTASKYVPADHPPVKPTSRSPRTGRGYRREPGDRVRGAKYYGEGYDPSVVCYWLKQHLRRLKWVECPGDVFVYRKTGEKYDLSGKANISQSTECRS